MKKQICILTKSYKNGGYCVAGIDVESKQWVRLVNSEDHTADEIRKEQMFFNGKAINCLDVLEYDFIDNIPFSCQTENWLLNNSIPPKFVKTISLEELINFAIIDEEEFFIYNKLNLLNDREIVKVKRSLFLFHVKNLKIEAKSYEKNGEIRFRYKCVFEYNGEKYSNISLTDPLYRDVVLDGEVLEEALIIASLPCIPYTDGSFYKFVAKIIPIDEEIFTHKEKGNFNQQTNEEDIENDNCFSNKEILICVANSVNPYTGEKILGIDEELKKALLKIGENKPELVKVDNKKNKIREKDFYQYSKGLIIGIDIVEQEEITKKDEKGSPRKMVKSQGIEEKDVTTVVLAGEEVLVDNEGTILTDINLLKRLKKLRKRIGDERKIPYFVIASNKVLVRLATNKPTTREEFVAIKGIRYRWFDKNGPIFMKEINDYIGGK